jgi:hypothetical protein
MKIFYQKNRGKNREKILPEKTSEIFRILIFKKMKIFYQKKSRKNFTRKIFKNIEKINLQKYSEN